MNSTEREMQWLSNVSMNPNPIQINIEINVRKFWVGMKTFNWKN